MLQYKVWYSYLIIFLSIGMTSCVSDSNTKVSNTVADSTIENQNKKELKNIPTPLTIEKEPSIKNTNSNKSITPKSNNAVVNKDQPNITKTPISSSATAKLPDACSLISDAFIAKTVGVDVGAINIKDGSSAASKTARSCFFRWDHKGVANSGVLVQIQQNPLPEEIDNWAAYYLQAKINQGDTNPNTMESSKFKPFNELGVSGAYSFNMHRYLWRTDNDKVFMIAFNLNATEKEELSWTKTLGDEIMKNYRP